MQYSLARLLDLLHKGELCHNQYKTDEAIKTLSGEDLTRSTRVSQRIFEKRLTVRSLLYGFPIVSQAGLGNMLIPWADCLLWSKDNGAQMISPFWTKLRLGQLLRHERDKRLYHRYFVPSGQIHGLRRLFLLATSEHINENDWRSGQTKPSVGEPIVVCFSNMNLFKNLIGRDAEIRLALYRITKPCFHPSRLCNGKPFVGIHVRRGDYPSMGEGAPIAYRLPLEWYIGCLLEIRQALGIELPAVVFSDGTDMELFPLLDIPLVSRSPFRESITDLLALAESTVLITSRSTFSLWGAYLGQMPSVWYPPKSDICDESILAGKNIDELEIEWMIGGPLPYGFVYGIRDRMKHKGTSKSFQASK